VLRSAEAMLDDVELHQIRGVYRGGDSRLSVIHPKALAAQGDCYEFEPGGPGHEDTLRLDLTGAFDKPCRVQVDACWSQPRLWSVAAGRIALVPRTRRLPGITFRSVAPVRPAHPSPLARDPSRCLDVLSLKVRPVLARADLVGMLEILGAGADSYFRGLPSMIDELESSQTVDPERRSGKIRRVYRMALRSRRPEEEPLLRRVAREGAKLLDAWTEDTVDVEVVTRREHVARASLRESA
jgi:hypothetical protein